VKVRAIVLAAGEGRRMGGGKLTLPFGQTTIIRAVAGALIDVPVAGITTVVGHHADDVQAALEGIPTAYATNPDPERGMLSSVKFGIRAAGDDQDAFLIVLGDQPELDPRAIRDLIRAAETSDKWMFIPRFEGRRGHPVLFKSEARDAILALPEKTGLNAWRDSHPELVEMVDVEAPEILHDIDTPDDYRDALNRLDRH
jgi:molybdenum cofactor cytidylyltransferase